MSWLLPGGRALNVYIYIYIYMYTGASRWLAHFCVHFVEGGASARYIFKYVFFASRRLDLALRVLCRDLGNFGCPIVCSVSVWWVRAGLRQ